MTVEEIEVSNGLDLSLDDLSNITTSAQRAFIERLDQFMIDNGASGRSIIPQGEVVDLCLDLRNLVKQWWVESNA